MFGGGLFGGLEFEVEVDFGVAAGVQATGAGGAGVVAEVDVGDEFVAGGVGEVVVQVFVAGQVDLGGQVTMAGGGNEEVDVRRALAVAAEAVE